MVHDEVERAGYGAYHYVEDAHVVHSIVGYVLVQVRWGEHSDT